MSASPSRSYRAGPDDIFRKCSLLKPHNPFFCRSRINHISQASLACMLSHFSHVQLFMIPRTVAARLHCPWDSPDKNTGVGFHLLLQGIFPTQGSNLGFLLCRQILYYYMPAIKKQRHHFADKGPHSESYGFSIVTQGYWIRKWTLTLVSLPGRSHG